MLRPRDPVMRLIHDHADDPEQALDVWAAMLGRGLAVLALLSLPVLMAVLLHILT